MLSPAPVLCTDAPPLLHGRFVVSARTVHLPTVRVASPASHLPLRVCLAGETMRIASSEFADDPCSSVKRGTMVRAARALLSAVTRLLILADMADVMRLLSHLKIVRMEKVNTGLMRVVLLSLCIAVLYSTRAVSMLVTSLVYPLKWKGSDFPLFCGA